MQTVLYVALVVLLVIYSCVWLWGMRVAFTQGDDVVARFGRGVLSVFKRSSPSYWMAKNTIGNMALRSPLQQDKVFKYKLVNDLPDCTEEEVNRTFDYMDEWKENLQSPFTLELLHEIFPQYSSGECEVIFKSWENAQK